MLTDLQLVDSPLWLLHGIFRVYINMTLLYKDIQDEFIAQQNILKKEYVFICLLDPYLHIYGTTNTPLDTFVFRYFSS